MKFNNEMKIGLMVSGVALLLVILTARAGDFNLFKEGYLVKAEFSTVDGVDTNAPVRLNGMEIGHVKDIRIIYAQPTKMQVTLWIEEGVNLPPGTRAHVKNMGLLGEKYISLTAGKESGPYLSAGTVIPGEEPSDFQALLADGQEVANNLKEISANLNERLTVNKEAIDEIVMNMNVTMGNFASISSNIDERLEVNDHLIDEIIGNMHSTSVNLEELSYDLKQNPWKLMYRMKEKKKKQAE